MFTPSLFSWRSLASALAVVAVVLLQQASGQQPSSAPEWSGDYFWSGDQIIHRSLLVSDADRRQGPIQGTADDGFYPRGLGDTSGWSFGVLPIEFDPSFPVERQAMFWSACQEWSKGAPVMCVPRTSQLGFIRVTSASAGCFANVGGSFRLQSTVINLANNCHTIAAHIHEIGHALGLIHEHQRPDRDEYITVDFSNVAEVNRFAFVTLPIRPLGAYDFASIMHYEAKTAAVDSTRPVIVPQPGYASFASVMGKGNANAPTELDFESVRGLYRLQLNPIGFTAPSEAPRTRFDRTDFLDAMERLHALYMSPMGLQRSGGPSIGGRPDFQGIATWIFDVYLAARSRGFSANQSFQIVTADVTRSQEWRDKHPGEASLTRPSFTPVVSFDRNEFLNTLNRLDAFYSAPGGLQRPEGLSISGGPDFLGIAAWLFDFYLNERLSGGSPTVAWNRVENAIRNTDEWRAKHP